MGIFEKLTTDLEHLTSKQDTKTDSLMSEDFIFDVVFWRYESMRTLWYIIIYTSIRYLWMESSGWYFTISGPCRLCLQCYHELRYHGFIYYTAFINLQRSKISQWNDNKQRSNSQLVKQTRMLHVLIAASPKKKHSKPGEKWLWISLYLRGYLYIVVVYTNLW